MENLKAEDMRILNEPCPECGWIMTYGASPNSVRCMLCGFTAAVRSDENGAGEPEKGDI